MRLTVNQTNPRRGIRMINYEPFKHEEDNIRASLGISDERCDEIVDALELSLKDTHRLSERLEAVCKVSNTVNEALFFAFKIGKAARLSGNEEGEKVYYLEGSKDRILKEELEKRMKEISKQVDI